ncbi:DNA-binding domain-containing protein [Hansschlegelia sp.]|uniref:HvfC/BufC N-terminal domain-containing protein n=1 Tax=Hansschlegelia sp. TaxID=2041892 RepID=UPI002B84B3FE|nr:DNA-binding domain-containing protein [Hansschlegelia sp.]HVI27898.1 DNA-binding domain-containing protein [Hansschlegelia sp.]
MRSAEDHSTRRSSTFAADFAPGLTDPGRPTPPNVIGPGSKKAGKRYDVYRNNVTVSLIDALAAIFPATQRLTGVEFFRAMARFHVRACPPHSPLLFEYGRDFPAFISAYEYARELPYLADVARLERAWLDAYHAADALTLSSQALAAIPPETLGDIRFQAHPAARVVRSLFPALSLFVMNRGDGPIGQVEFAPEDALVTRPDAEVFVRSLPPGGAVFLKALVDGQTLDQAANEAFDASESFDLPGNIAGMIEAGVFVAISSGDH